MERPGLGEGIGYLTRSIVSDLAELSDEEAGPLKSAPFSFREAAAAAAADSPPSAADAGCNYLRDRKASVDKGSELHRAVLGDLLSSVEQRRRSEDALLERLQGEEALRRGSEGVHTAVAAASSLSEHGTPTHSHHPSQQRQHHATEQLTYYRRPPAVVTFRTTVSRQFGRSGRTLDVDLQVSPDPPN